MDITTIIAGLSTLGPALGSVAIAAMMVFWLIKRDADATERQDKKDAEYLKTLSSLQETSRAHADLLLRMSENVNANTEATKSNNEAVKHMTNLLNRFNCIRNNQPQ